MRSIRSVVCTSIKMSTNGCQHRLCICWLPPRMDSQPLQPAMLPIRAANVTDLPPAMLPTDSQRHWLATSHVPEISADAYSTQTGCTYYVIHQFQTAVNNQIQREIYSVSGIHTGACKYIHCYLQTFELSREILRQELLVPNIQQSLSRHSPVAAAASRPSLTLQWNPTRKDFYHYGAEMLKSLSISVSVVYSRLPIRSTYWILWTHQQKLLTHVLTLVHSVIGKIYKVAKLLFFQALLSVAFLSISTPSHYEDQLKQGHSSQNAQPLWEGKFITWQKLMEKSVLLSSTSNS